MSQVRPHVEDAAIGEKSPRASGCASQSFCRLTPSQPRLRRREVAASHRREGRGRGGSWPARSQAHARVLTSVAAACACARAVPREPLRSRFGVHGSLHAHASSDARPLAAPLPQARAKASMIYMAVVMKLVGLICLLFVRASHCCARSACTSASRKSLCRSLPLHLTPCSCSLCSRAHHLCVCVFVQVRAFCLPRSLAALIACGMLACVVYMVQGARSPRLAATATSRFTPRTSARRTPRTALRYRRVCCALPLLANAFAEHDDRRAARAGAEDRSKIPRTPLFASALVRPHPVDGCISSRLVHHHTLCLLPAVPRGLQANSRAASGVLRWCPRTHRPHLASPCLFGALLCTCYRPF
eukprot:784274-Pleurochrysis_carterae.AAC.3